MQIPGTEAQSKPKSSPQTKTGNKQNSKSQIQRNHMVNRVSSFFPKGGHSATQTELKII